MTSISTAGTGLPTEVGDAVERATAAAPALAAQDLTARAAMLRAAADGLEADRPALVELAASESGLGTVRLEGELSRTTGQLRLFADVVGEGSWLEAIVDHADATSAPPRPDLRRLLLPLGPVAVYSASNFPFAFSVAGGDTAAALAAGCPVVVKAHSGHPRLSDRTAAILDEAVRGAGAPAGTIGLLHGQDAGRDLVQHPGIRAGAFTGSLYAGRLLFDLACARPDPIPFYGELGSINPVVIGPERDREGAEALAAGLIGSFTLGQGQFCTKPGLVFLPSGSRIPALVGEQLAGAGDRMLTISIAESFDRGTAAIAAVAGVRVLGRGVAGEADAGGRVPSTPPTVFGTDLATAMANREVLFEECFGPSTLLVEYSDLDELSAALDLLPGALTATVHASAADVDQLAAVISQLGAKVGRLLFDGWPTGVAVTWSMQHGGPWPATTNPMFTSVGTTAIRRFLRPFTYQDAPEAVLPPALRGDNPWRIPRRIDGRLTLPV